MKPTNAIYIIILIAIIGTASCKKAQYSIACSDNYTYDTFEGGYIFMPNAFSPSSDGINDRLIVISKGVADYELQIFTMGHSKVFQKSTNSREFWYGEVYGKIGRSGSYTYVLSYTTNTGLKQVKTGSIALIDTYTEDAYLNQNCVENLSACVFGTQWQGDTLPLKPVQQSGEYFREECY